MGQRAIFLAIVFGSACSIIYNPNNIPKPTADATPPDAPIPDANPADLMLTSVEPAALLEGQGSDGSRAAVLVIHGQNIVPGAQVTIAPMDVSAMPMVSVAGSAVASSDHTMLAIPVEADVNATCPAGMATSGSIPLVVAVTQPGATMQTIPWSLTCLPDIDQSGSGAATCSGLGSGVPCTGNLALPTDAPNQFSRVVLTGSNTITLLNPPSPSQALIVRATGRIEVHGPIDVSANGTTAGPHGTGPAAGPGAGGNGGSGGLFSSSVGGGGAGYATAGTQGQGNNNSGGNVVGSDDLPSFDTCFASGGGNYTVTPLIGNPTTNSGGAGGGSIELSAGGSLEVKGVAAHGAPGASDAGGGAGGTIVLRGGSTITLDDSLDVKGGSGGGTLGGSGSPGRIRINAPALAGSGSPGTYYAGPAFDADPAQVPYIVSTSHPMLEIHGMAGSMIDVYSLDQNGQQSAMTTITLGAASTAKIAPALQPGLNQVCMVPSGVSVALAESVTCAWIAYVP